MTTTSQRSGPAALPAVLDPERLAAVECTGLARAEPSAPLDVFATLAAALADAPAAYVTLIGSDQQWSPGAVEHDVEGEPRRAIPSTDSICQFQVATGELMVISDTHQDPLTQHNVNVLDGAVAAYAGIPLRDGAGHVLGSLCVVDRHARLWSPVQLQMLHDLAAVVSRDLEHRAAGLRTERLEHVGRRLGSEIQELVEAVTGLVDRSEQHDDPGLQRFAARARSRALPIAGTLARFEEVLHQPAAQTRARSVPTDLRRVVERAVVATRASTQTDLVDLELPQDRLPVIADPVELESACIHLLLSALHHTVGGESLRVRVAQATPEGATLTLKALGAQIPAAELGRMVARFAAATTEAGQPVAPTGLQMIDGAISARCGRTSGHSSAHGLSFESAWLLSTSGEVALTLRR